MKHIVFSSQVQAEKFQADIDVELGYPKEGVNVGGGFHVPASQSRTLHHSALEKHPDRNEWAHVDDAIVVSKRARVPLPPTAESKELEPDWHPAAEPLEPERLAEDEPELK